MICRLYDNDNMFVTRILCDIVQVKHDNTVTWLATWTENVQGQNKYVMLNPASSLKGAKDWEKYKKASSLHKIIDRVRANYQNDWKSKEMRLRQRAVALYFIGE